MVMNYLFNCKESRPDIKKKNHTATFSSKRFGMRKSLAVMSVQYRILLLFSGSRMDESKRFDAKIPVFKEVDDDDDKTCLFAEPIFWSSLLIRGGRRIRIKSPRWVRIEIWSWKGEFGKNYKCVWGWEFFFKGFNYFK